MILKISKGNLIGRVLVKVGRGFISKKDASMWVTKSEAYFTSIKSSHIPTYCTKTQAIICHIFN